MKKLIFIIVAFLSGVPAFAQRWGYVDTDYILKHIPEFNSAQKQLNALSAQWQQETDSKYADVDKLYKAFQADQVLLSDEMRKRRESEIIAAEKAAKDFQNQKFGVQGDLYQEQVRLNKPVQDRVSKAIQAVAENRQLDMILDKSSNSTSIVYASPRLDISNDVVTRLGYKPGTFAEGSKP